MPAANARKCQLTKIARRRYEAGDRLTVIAQELKIPRPTLDAWLRNDGMKFRTSQLDNRARVDDAAIVARYREGESILGLARSFGVSRLVIDRRLADAGVQRRTMAEASKIATAAMTPAARRMRLEAAHAAVKGSSVSLAHRYARAVRKMAMSDMTPKELDYYSRLLTEGLPVVPQFAIEGFTVDFAVPDCRVAIEVQSFWSKFGAKAQKDSHKLARLKELNWETFSMCAKKWRCEWAEDLRQIVERRRKHFDQSFER